MTDNGFYGALTGILTLALLVLAGRVDWATLPTVAVLTLVWVAIGAVAVGLVVLHWAADRELAQPLAHPVC